MNEPQDGNYQRAWKTVLTDLKHHAPETLADVPYWQANKPGKHKADELYQYYVWAVYNAGMASRSLEATWDRIRAALRDFAIADIVAQKAAVRADLDCDTLIVRLCAASGIRPTFIALLGLPLGHPVTGAPMPLH